MHAMHVLYIRTLLRTFQAGVENMNPPGADPELDFGGGGLIVFFM